MLDNLVHLHQNSAEILHSASEKVSKQVIQDVMAVKDATADLYGVPKEIEAIRIEMQALSENEVAAISNAIVHSKENLELLSSSTVQAMHVRVQPDQLEILKFKVTIETLDELHTVQAITTDIHEQSKIYRRMLLDNQQESLRALQQVANAALEHFQALITNLRDVESQLAAWSLKSSFESWLIILLCIVLITGSTLSSRLGKSNVSLRHMPAKRKVCCLPSAGSLSWFHRGGYIYVNCPRYILLDT